MRVFLDTNVLVAAFATRGLCEDVMRTALSEHELVVGRSVLVELRKILTRKLRMPAQEVEAVIYFIEEHAETVEPEQPAPWPERDPDDRWVVAAAIEGKVDLLVTGDRDLLDLDADLPFQIVTPRRFWEELR